MFNFETATAIANAIILEDVTILSIDDGGFDWGLGISLENVTVTNGIITVTAKGIVNFGDYVHDTDDYDYDCSIEYWFEEAVSFALQGTEGYTITPA